MAVVPSRHLDGTQSICDGIPFRQNLFWGLVLILRVLGLWSVYDIGLWLGRQAKSHVNYVCLTIEN